MWIKPIWDFVLCSLDPPLWCAEHSDLFVAFVVQLQRGFTMTKADLVSEITDKTGVEKIAVQAIVESLMTTIIDAMESGENVYLRGFGSFVIKKRAEKTGRDISKNTTLIIPEHFVPTFKPAKTFVNDVKNKLKK
jgi:DNA-binding protein HU-beta